MAVAFSFFFFIAALTAAAAVSPLLSRRGRPPRSSSASSLIPAGRSSPLWTVSEGLWHGTLPAGRRLAVPVCHVRPAARSPFSPMQRLTGTPRCWTWSLTGAASTSPSPTRQRRLAFPSRRRRLGAPAAHPRWPCPTGSKRRLAGAPRSPGHPSCPSSLPPSHAHQVRLRRSVAVVGHVATLTPPPVLLSFSQLPQFSRNGACRSRCRR